MADDLDAHLDAEGAELEPLVGQSSVWGNAWKYLRTNPLFLIGLTVLVVMLAMALFPALFARGETQGFLGCVGCTLQAPAAPWCRATSRAATIHGAVRRAAATPPRALGTRAVPSEAPRRRAWRIAAMPGRASPRQTGFASV